MYILLGDDKWCFCLIHHKRDCKTIQPPLISVNLLITMPRYPIPFPLVTRLPFCLLLSSLCFLSRFLFRVFGRHFDFTFVSSSKSLWLDTLNTDVGRLSCSLSFFLNGFFPQSARLIFRLHRNDPYIVLNQNGLTVPLHFIDKTVKKTSKNTKRHFLRN